MFPVGATGTFSRVGPGSQLWGHFANKATHAGFNNGESLRPISTRSSQGEPSTATLSVFFVFLFWFWGKRGCCLCLLVLVNAVAFIKNDGRYNI